MTGINLPQGPLLPQMMAFAIPYLLACFLQTFYGISVCIIFGLLATLIVHFCAEWVISLFVSHEPEVVRLGGEYFRTYVIDCIFAGIHFCFSGYFSAYGKSIFSFLHNMDLDRHRPHPRHLPRHPPLPRDTVSDGPCCTDGLPSLRHHMHGALSLEIQSIRRPEIGLESGRHLCSESSLSLKIPRDLKSTAQKSTDTCRCFLLAIS